MMIHFDQFKHLNIKRMYGPYYQEVVHLAFHSKRVERNFAFFSIKGESFNGDQYVAEAVQNGASLIIGVNESLFLELSQTYPHCTFIVVEDVREAMASFSKFFFGNSDERLTTIGVTGTNGKTTVTAYVRSLLTLLGMKTGSIGTTGIWSSQRRFVYKKSTPTTPESLDLHHIFRDLVVEGDHAAVMEVSSIALDQQRVEGITFDVAIHTNFSEEHLEYHKTIDHYRECKMRLFHQSVHKVVNIDDDGMGEDLLKLHDENMITYSIQSNSEADLKAENIEVTEEGSIFDLSYNGTTSKVYVPVYGTYNVANVLSAIGTSLLLGFTMGEILSVLPNLEGPEGRFQVIQTPHNQKVILDYAHTPVALERLLEEVKKLDYRQLIVMIAGIGIRDFNKMPKMAAAIEGKADQVVVTVDHPGYHHPQVIIDQVMTGFKEPEAPYIHTAQTRAEGVKRSLDLGKENDIILLTSGCINNAQIVRGEEIPHSDEEIIDSYYRPVML